MKIKKNRKWIVEYYYGCINYDYTGYKDNRKSITGSIVIFRGALIAWKLKGGIITQSLTTIEYYDQSEMCTDILCEVGS